MTQVVYSPTFRYDRPWLIVRVAAPQQFARGGLVTSARRLAAAGRYGDDMLVHVNRDEFNEMRKSWGEPTINPKTGLPEYWLMALLGALKAFFGTAAGHAVLSGAAVGAGTAAVKGGNVVKGALTGAAMGGLGSWATGSLGSGIGAAKNAYYGATPAGATVAADVAKEAAASGAASGAASSAAPTTAAKLGALAASSESAAPAAATGAGSGMVGALAQKALDNPMATAMVASALSGSGASPSDAPPAANPTATDPNFLTHLTPSKLNRTRQPMLENIDDWYHYGEKPQQPFYLNNDLGTSPLVPPGTNVAAPPVDVSTGLEGLSPEQRRWAQAMMARSGNYGQIQAAAGGSIAGPGTGRSDSIPAKLSDGEYVMDAETVSLLGDGSARAGAARLDQLRQSLRQHKGKALAKGKFTPAAKPPSSYLPPLKKARGGSVLGKLFNVFGVISDDDGHTLDRNYLVKAESTSHAKQVIKAADPDLKSHTVRSLSDADLKDMGLDRRAKTIKLGDHYLHDEGT